MRNYNYTPPPSHRYADIQGKNMEFWRNPTMKTREDIEHRMPYFQAFFDRIKAGLKDTKNIDFSFDQYAGKKVAEVAGWS